MFIKALDALGYDVQITYVKKKSKQKKGSWGMEKKANEDSPSMGVLYELNIGDSTSFASSITDALSYAESEIQMFNETLKFQSKRNTTSKDNR